MQSPCYSAPANLPTWARVIKIERPGVGDFALGFAIRKPHHAKFQ
jgi:hypothetical protein